MYSKKRIMRMSDAELMSAYHGARAEVYRLYSKDPDMIHIGAYTDAQETMIRTLRLMVRRGFYLPTVGEQELLDENKFLKRAITAKIEYMSYHGCFEGEADIRAYVKVLRRAHPEFVADFSDCEWDGDDDDDCLEDEINICNTSIIQPGMEPGGTGIGTITITLDDGTQIVHEMSSYPKGTQHLLISIVRWASEGSQ